jgi:class 3 adenylate cyclase
MSSYRQKGVALWNRLIRVGAAGHDSYTQKRIVVTNTLAMLICLFILPYLALYASQGPAAMAVPLLSAVPMFLLVMLTPLMHRFGPNVAAWYLLALWAGFSVLYNYFFGRDAGLQYLFLPGSAAGILVFGVRQIKPALLSMLLGVAGFLVTENLFMTPAPFIEISPEFARLMYLVSLVTSFTLIFAIVYFANLQAMISDARFQEEYLRSENLLYNVLPEAIANELKQQPGKTIARTHEAATILFADIVEFTPKASRLSASQIVEVLNALFSEFDDLTRKHGLEKVKTIGDAFMAAGGLPVEQADHAERVGRLALDMIRSVERFSGMAGERILLRIGINSGPVVAGVIGNQKLVYDVWGDTVNTAGRMETYCMPQRIQITTAFRDLTRDVFTFERRGRIEVKGLGQVEAWYLTGLLAEENPRPETAKSA